MKKLQNKNSKRDSSSKIKQKCLSEICNTELTLLFKEKFLPSLP